MQEITYAGNELALFQHAVEWKKYFARFIRPFLHGKVLEVGAGTGASTTYLYNGRQTSWTCLEPDRRLFRELQKRVALQASPSPFIAVKGTLQDVDRDLRFDSIVYIDVIEHIENDRAEMDQAAGLLNKAGYLVVLVPAHPSLYSPFDKAIGHYRRYNRSSLLAIAPPGLEPVEVKYLDSAGWLASWSNKVILKQDYPTLSQIKFWDRFLVPVSRITDRLSGYRFGKSLLIVWKKKT